MTEDLHSRQREIVEYLRRRSRQGGYPPSVREIGRAVGLSSSSTVQNHLNILERKGVIRRDPTKSRTVLLTDSPAARASQSLVLPLVGQVAAGVPILAEQNIEDRLAVGPEIAGREDSFLLRVRGDSMTGEGIFDGDLVVVEPGPDLANGAIGVVRIENPATGDNEVTVKRVYRESGRLRLQPANEAYPPMIVSEAVIEGRVAAVIRVLRS
ncbi:MAG: transcriptional repressor LexA [Candidatus Dormibacteria bacterium]